MFMKGSKIMRKFIAALSATFIIAGCAAGCNPSSSSDSSCSSGGDSSYEEPVSETYTVVFDSDGGTEVGSVTVKEGGRLLEPKTPVKANTRETYSFVGWYLGDREWRFDKDVVTDNITLVAKWKLEEKYTEPLLPE